jgi:hypothetical protein
MLCGSLSQWHGASSDAVGGDDLKIWRVVANILNKQWRANMGGTPAWDLGEGLIPPYSKKKEPVMKCHTGCRNWTDSLERPT